MEYDRIVIVFLIKLYCTRLNYSYVIHEHVNTVSQMRLNIVRFVLNEVQTDKHARHYQGCRDNE